MLDKRPGARIVDSLQEDFALLFPLSSWKIEKDSDSPSKSLNKLVCVGGGNDQDLGHLVLRFVSY